VAGLRSKELRERFNADGIKVIGSTPEELAKYIITEHAKWANVVKRSGATVQ
jgi:tripartite-type tricarboxylate transporter receptor subunit TctC